MGETKVHDEVLAFLLRSVADAVDLEGLLEALGHAHDHVVDERTGQTVQRAISLLIAGTGHLYQF